MQVCGKHEVKTRKFVELTLILFQILLWTHAGQCAELAGDKIVVVGGDHFYPPYEFINTNDEPDGYNVELTKPIAEVMGLKVEIRLGSWRLMREALEDGKLDALQGIVFSAERSKMFDFSPSHTIVNESLYRRSNSPSLSDLNELKGKSVIVQNYGRMHDFLVATDLDIELILADTHADALRLLASGKGDFALVSNLPAAYLGKKLHLSNILPTGKLVSGERYCYAVKKGNTERLTLFSEGLAILKKSGDTSKSMKNGCIPLRPVPSPGKKSLNSEQLSLFPYYWQSSDLLYGAIP